jgi:hypothetical protein
MPGRAARHLVLAADIPSTAAICPHAPGATGTLAQIRQVAGRLFDLRKTAAIDLLNRMGATICGQAFVIGRGQLMARLREAQEHPGWRWEVVRT